MHKSELYLSPTSLAYKRAKNKIWMQAYRKSEKYQTDQAKRNLWRNKWNKVHPYKSHTYQIKRKYGLPITEYNAMVAAQGGRCAICHELDTRRLSIDHNHKTHAIRQLLCSHCNFMIGHSRERVDLLQAAIDYLQK